MAKARLRRYSAGENQGWNLPVGMVHHILISSMIHNKSIRRFIASALCVILLSGLLPPAGPAPVMAFSVGDEKDVGDKLLSLIRKEFTILDDPDLTAYLTDLGRQTLRLAGPQFFSYHFFLIDNKEFNAFAAPSGLIFFHSGLIELCDSEGELVSVLAHEIGHAASRHIADRMDKAGKLSAATAAMMLAGLLIGQGGAISQAVLTGAAAGNLTANLKFSREDEEEADRLAYKWMLEQGRDPVEMVQMLKKMRRASRYHRKQVPTYLLTHPEPESRIGYVDDLMNQTPPLSFGPRDEFAYRRFKYRVQALTRESQSLLPILTKKSEESDAIEKDPMSFYGLSQVYLSDRDFPRAEEALRKVIRRFPDKQILKTDLGRIWLEAGDTKNALRMFQEIEQISPEDLYNTYYLAKALQQSGEMLKAVLIYEKLTEHLPAPAKLYQEIGKLRTALGDKALGHYNLALAQHYEGSKNAARYHLTQAMKGLSEKDPLYAKLRELKLKIERIEKM